MLSGCSRYPGVCQGWKNKSKSGIRVVQEGSKLLQVEVFCWWEGGEDRCCLSVHPSVCLSLPLPLSAPPSAGLGAPCRGGCPSLEPCLGTRMEVSPGGGSPGSSVPTLLTGDPVGTLSPPCPPHRTSPPWRRR